MKFSLIEDYSLRCLTYLARHPRQKVTLGRIAEAEGLSVENTAKIMARLRDAGLVDSFRGKDGGYALAFPAEQLSIARILGSVSGEFFELDLCRGDATDGACVHHGECNIRSVWTSLASVIHGFLEQVTLADLLKPHPLVDLETLRSVVRETTASHGSALPAFAPERS